MANRFEGYQQAKQEARTVLINEYLGALSKSIKIRNVTHLADLAADYLSAQQSTPCTRSTLLRNEKYKKLLLNHMAAGKLGRGSANIKDSDIRDPKAKALIRTLQIENASLRRESARIKAYIESEESLAFLQRGMIAAGPALPNGVADYAKDVDYGLVCKALLRLIHHFKNVVYINQDEIKLIDLSVVRNGTIVEGDDLAPFISWLKRHPETAAAFGF